MRLTFRDKIFLLENVSSSDEKKARRHGFVFDRAAGVWFNSDIRSAAHLRDYADGIAKKIISRKYLVRTPWVGRIPIPKGLAPLPFQKPAIRFALEQNRAYWWNDMGTGKGPSSAMVINALSSRAPIFVCYVTPPELIYNVEAELNKWLVKRHGLRVEIFRLKVKTKTVKGKRKSWLVQPTFDWGRERIRVLVLPDTMLGKVDRITWKAAEYEPIGNRDLFMIVDEADRFKNPGSDRTRDLLGYNVKGEGPVKGAADRFPRVLYMSGTALPNGCPLELYPVLSHSAPETIDFMDYYRFAWRFCVAKKSRYGVKFQDIRREDELFDRLFGKFVFRLEKKELDLPARIESALVISADMKPKLAELERRILRKYSPEDLMKSTIAKSTGKKKEDLHLMTYRRLLGAEKVKPLLPYIRTLLETQSVLIGCLHTEVVDLLAKGLAKHAPVVIDGRVDKKERHRRLEEFKRDKRHRPVIANQAAMRRGFTVLKCKRVLNVEWSWVPGDDDQFGDRTHRIGQDEDVYIQYAMFRNSVDMGVLDAKFRKRNSLKKLHKGST